MYKLIKMIGGGRALPSGGYTPPHRQDFKQIPPTKYIGKNLYPWHVMQKLFLVLTGGVNVL